MRRMYEWVSDACACDMTQLTHICDTCVCDMIWLTITYVTNVTWLDSPIYVTHVCVTWLNSFICVTNMCVTWLTHVGDTCVCDMYMTNVWVTWLSSLTTRDTYLCDMTWYLRYRCVWHDSTLTHICNTYLLYVTHIMSELSICVTYTSVWSHVTSVNK